MLTPTQLTQLVKPTTQILPVSQPTQQEAWSQASTQAATQSATQLTQASIDSITQAFLLATNAIPLSTPHLRPPPAKRSYSRSSLSSNNSSNTNFQIHVLDINGTATSPC